MKCLRVNNRRPQKKTQVSRNPALDRATPPHTSPQGLKPLLQCLASYVEANFQRFVYREERFKSGHVIILVLKRDGI
jgi:hypothetical protein